MKNPGQSLLALIGLVALSAVTAAHPALSAPATQPARQPAADPNAAERAKWENLIVFFGEEDTGRYSLRILDRSVTTTAQFKYLELWKYDLEKKAWLKVDEREQTTRIVMPKDKREDSPEGNQLLGELPITNETLGLYYAKWQVNGIDCSTMTRIGPGPVGRQPDMGKIPHGMIVADVPLDKSKGQRMIVPDPRSTTSGK